MATLDAKATVRTISGGDETLDRILGGGLPAYSTTAIIGGPGTGKTTLAQQIAYTYADRSGGRTLYLTAFGEPRAKVIRHVQQFRFFSERAFGQQVLYGEVGNLLHDRSPSEAIEILVRLVGDQKADLLIIDSFPALLDFPLLGRAAWEFCHGLSERLLYARCTTLLLGYFERDDRNIRPILATADCVISLRVKRSSEELSRRLCVQKMRGQNADRRTHRYAIQTGRIAVLKQDGEQEPADADHRKALLASLPRDPN